MFILSVDNHYEKLLILLSLQWISFNDAPLCTFTATPYAYDLNQQLQVESWGYDMYSNTSQSRYNCANPRLSRTTSTKTLVDEEDCQQSNSHEFVNGNIKFSIHDANQLWSIYRQSDRFALLQTQSSTSLLYSYPASVYLPMYALCKLSLIYTHGQTGQLYGLGQHNFSPSLTLQYDNFHLPFVPANGDISIPRYIYISGFEFL